MDGFTTNGGRAIPILVVMDGETGAVITRWGPRPAPAQQMVLDYKALPADKPPYQEFVKELQLWYLHDHTRTLQAELLEMVLALESRS
jgi:Thioredoxin